MKNNNVERAIQALQKGKMILLTDHPDRENEADIVFPAENITPEIMNFIIRHTSGIVCLSLTPEHLERLRLPLLVAADQNTTKHRTPFTMPIDAREGITTGVSAHDRAKTIQTVMQANVQPEALVRPGHVYPLQAKIGGVLERAGHTEGAIDLVRLAGFKPAAILCEVMNADGTMARGDALKTFAKQHQLPLLSIAELVHYRLKHEDQIKEKTSAKISLEAYGDFTISVIQEKYCLKEHLILSKLAVDPTKPLLVRIHSACTTGDIFHSTRCDCHQQLHYSLKKISEEGGLLIYLEQEGRGIGLLNKIKAYALQDQGLDTVEANEQLGLPIDQREYYIAAQILRDLQLTSIRLLTNNPQKISGLTRYGFPEVIREVMPVFYHAHNRRYLQAKKTKLAHWITGEV